MNSRTSEIVEYKNVKIEKIIFSRDNYYVFIGLLDNKDKEKFVSNIPINVGEKWDIQGSITYYKDEKQIRVKDMERNDSLDLDDLKSYLTTFNGIGKVKAKKILDTFGSDIFNVIKNEYLKLVTLGIPEKSAYEMHCFVTQNEEFNKLLKLLSPYDISINSAHKIYSRYKDKSIDILLSNPYIVRDMLNLSFDLVDYFAINNNINPIDTTRIMGAVKEAMKRNAEKGHTFCYVSDLLEATKSILNKRVANEKALVTNADIVKVLIYMSEEQKELIIKEDSSCFTPSFYYEEKNIARKLSRMVGKKREIKFDINEVISEIEKDVGFPYSLNQKGAIKTSIENLISIITGGPGTGKTTTVNGITKVLKKINPDIKIMMAAPTGAAAKRMENTTGMAAKTIHRLLEYCPFDGELTCGRNEDNPLEADVLIMDESSMTDVPLMNLFLRAIGEDTMLIIIGDVDQLPSVGAGNVLRDLIDSKVIPVSRLDTVYRQKGTSTIVLNSKRLSDGVGIDLSKDDFKLIETLPKDDVIAQLIVDRYVNLLASGKTTDDVQVLCPMRKKENKASSTAINIMIQDRINPSKQGKGEVVYGFRCFREGDKVVQQKNNYEKSSFNGDLGYITSITKEQDYIVTVKFDDREISFTGREEILELDLAYCMTIHKSQGSEFKHVLMPMTMTQKPTLTRNLFYTGFTRAKEIVEFFGTREAIDYAVANVDQSKRYSKLCPYMTEAVTKFVA